VSVRDIKDHPSGRSPNGIVPESNQADDDFLSSPNRNELDFANSMLDTDIVMFNYREG